MSSIIVKKHVVHLMSGYGGGISSFIRNKADFFASDSSVSFDVITFDDVPNSFKEQINKTGGKMYKITNPKVSVARFFREVFEIFDALSPETIIHSHFGMNLCIIFWGIARIKRIKRFVIHAHTDAPKAISDLPSNKIKRYLNGLLSSEKLSCGTEASINVFGKKYVETLKITHIPNSIDEEKFLSIDYSLEKKEKILGKENSDKIIIGNIGRFHQQKNHKFMIQLIKNMSEIHNNFLWVLIGDGQLMEQVKNEVQEHSLEKYVLFLGRRNDIPDLLSIMDVFVLPSLYEGLPTVAIEAQASGVQCLIADTVTQEADLGMGNVEYISLDKPDQWVNSVLVRSKMKRPLKSIRLKKLQEKKFTNTESAKLYKSFLNEEIKHYNI